MEDKVTEAFKKTIKEFLNDFASKDAKFKEKYGNTEKNIDDCIQYILNTVQKKEVNGFTDGEIYGMALHYYDEKKINIGKAIDMTVKINHHVEFTEEERAEIIKEAREKVFNQEANRMKKKPGKQPDYIERKKAELEKKENKTVPDQGSLF